MVNYQKWTESWATQALRVAKPGSTLLCFGGTRTYHRLACAIEDAGWIIKDCIMWIYGSGFPKATDISKQIDKRRTTDIEKFARYMKEKREKKGISLKEMNNTFGYVAGCNWWESKGENFRYPNWKDYQKLKVLLDLDDRYDDYLRINIGEKIGESTRGNAGFSNEQVPRPWKKKIGEVMDVTLPATPEATLWNGWKSHGLKPAYEPILICMKPNEGSYANNALKWGVAGLNIDEGRIGTNRSKEPREYDKENASGMNCGNSNFGKDLIKSTGFMNQGRYPANVILNEESAGLLDEQAPKTGAFAKVKSGHSGKSKGIYHDYAQRGDDGGTFYDDGLQGASRFFYCAKASKSERNRGCEELENVKFTAGNYSQSPVCKDCGKTLNGTNDHSNCSGEIEYREMKSKKTGNNHPTVKPLALMKYLCRLTKTPTGGIALDPFCGSGTTLMACKELKRDYIGIDNNPEYCEIARKRVNSIPESLF
jgi:DNA modification methylase